MIVVVLARAHIVLRVGRPAVVLGKLVLL